MIRQGPWVPKRATALYGKRPAVGQILGSHFQAWRVVRVDDVLPIDPDSPQYIIQVVPIMAGGAEGEKHGMTVTERRMPSGDLRSPTFHVLEEHFDVCGRCGDVQPCREEWAKAQGRHAARELDRFTRPGFCPACEEPITLRQKTIELANVVTPFGGTILFHHRRKCLSDAIRYEERVHQETGAPLTLSCKGRIIHHEDDTRECLDPDCPGTSARHREYMRCYIRSHGCPRLECQIATGRN